MNFVSESLEQKGKRWSKAMQDAHFGPLVIALEIKETAKSWDKHQAGGLSCTAWLKKNVGNTLGYYQSRAEAVQLLGESCRRTINHDVAVYVANNVPENRISEVRDELIRFQKLNGGIPMSPQAARQKIKELLGVERFHVRGCSKCDTKEARIRELEAECVQLRKLLASYESQLTSTWTGT